MHADSLNADPMVELAEETVTVDEAFQRGARHNQEGKLCEAQSIYRAILSACPDHPRALHALGVVSFRAGAGEEAVSLIRRAIELKPDFADACNNLGNVLKGLERKEEALEAYQAALELRPDFADAAGNLGQLLLALGRVEEAIAALESAARLRPGSMEAHGNLGLAYQRACLFDAALQSFRKVLELDPDHAPTHSNVGLVHLKSGRWDEAVASYRRALELSPGDCDSLSILGMTLTFLGRVDEALACLRQALDLDPDHATALNALGNALVSRGSVDEAIASYRTACARHPDYLSAASNLVLALNYSDRVSQREIFEESIRYGALLPSPGTNLPGPPQAHPDPLRILRVGYLSSDLRKHPVSYFLAPLLANHDRSEIETICYANVTAPDMVTARLRALADDWVEVAGMDPAAVARRIREDRIDILVELNGHTGGHLLEVMSRKPAPVQVSWLGYPNTTGVAAIDYRLTDALADPPGQADLWHSEELYRLPHGFLCYEPPADAPPVAPAPALANGFVTFGSFNNLAKMTPQVIELWARLLVRLPGSRLVLKNRSLVDPGTASYFLESFEKNGVSRDRVSTLPYTDSSVSHLAAYGGIDLALDPFPYNGTTTTCDSLWMGVPVLTLTGDRHGARVGASILARVGLEELAAATSEGFLARAVELALDRERLSMLRGSLRERMANSDLCNGKQFAREVERALRSFWQAWCAGRGGQEISAPEAAPQQSAPATLPAALAPFYCSLAERYRESGRPGKAVEAYRQALSADPALLQARRGLGLVLGSLGKREEARDELLLAGTGCGEDAAAHNELGELLAELGYPEQAQELFRRALALDPSLAVAHFNLAYSSMLQGELEAARRGYLAALELDPSLALAHNNLGNLYCKEGRFQEAEASFRDGLAIEPDSTVLHNNLGGLFRELGRLQEALPHLRKATELAPGHAEAWTNLGVVLASLNDHEEALRAHQKALELSPELAVAHNNLGNLLVDRDEPEQAALSYRRALELDPGSVDAHANLGNALTLLGRPEEALESCRAALRLNPEAPFALVNLGNALVELGRHEEALESFRASLRARAHHPEALYNMSLALKELNRPEEAEAAARQAIAQKADYLEAWCSLGSVLMAQVKIEEAIESLRSGLEINPVDLTARANLVFLMNYSPSHSVADIYREARLLGGHFPPPSQTTHPQRELRDPARRLRIGYVSGDFGRHPVGYFLAPVLAAHDHAQVEIFCYSSRRPDDLTRRLMSCADVWRSTVGMSDATLERTIRNDQIDILVDLSGHTSGNRLSVFARKPAPVQATWAGYVGTTGLSAIDYLISDWRESPPGSEELSTERIVRLPDGYLCYEAPEYAPPVGPLPLQRNGHPTFGCFNNLNKINAQVIALWARLLQRMPDARLLLVTKELGAEVNRRRFSELFAAHGLAERVELCGKLPHRDLLARYNEIDIALDPFPYSGGLTTMESLWMGVPVVTLGGDRFASRHSLTHLTAAGLPELAVEGPQQYLELAETLARDPQRLAKLRAELRGRMASSPLCDGPRFTANLESAYRQMWQAWCEAGDE